MTGFLLFYAGGSVATFINALHQSDLRWKNSAIVAATWPVLLLVMAIDYFEVADRG